MNSKITSWLAASFAICFIIALGVTFLDYLGRYSLDKLESVDPSFPFDYGILDCFGLLAGILISLPLFALKSFLFIPLSGMDSEVTRWGDGTWTLLNIGFDVSLGLVLGLLLQTVLFLSYYAIQLIAQFSFQPQTKG